MRWLLRHPSPWDLFNVIEDVHGADLDWFWSPWFYGTAALDHAIASVSMDSAGARATIVVEDRGDAPLPVLLVVTLADGSVRELRMPVEPWLAGAREQSVTIDVSAPVTRVEIDPRRYLPDVERASTVWAR
jgi:hypothetical protein